MEFVIITTLTVFLLLISSIKSLTKTKMALVIAWNKFIRLLLPLLLMIGLMSFLTALLPQERIAALLQRNNLGLMSAVAAFLGSISLMPGFIAFPMGGVLRDNEVPYMVIASFTTTLMMVGITTLPIEQKFFGIKVSLIRNGLALLTALVVSFVTGLAYGELFI